MPVSPFIISALLGGAISTVNGILQRRQQNNLALQNQNSQAVIQKNRQDFDLQIHENNANLQRELSMRNHQFRLKEQLNQFNISCNQANYQYFLKTWPLINLPDIIRDEQVLSDDTVALRVIFSKSKDEIFSKYVYPRVEQGLLEFVDLYHNNFNSNNIIFYHNGFVGDVTGGAIVTNIHHALKELPVIVIDTTVLVDELCVSFSMWGLGSSEQKRSTVFRMPYRVTVSNGKIVNEYYDVIVEKILAYLKFLLGYAYDVYNLFEYDRPPLLPEIASYEMKNPKNIRGIMLKNKDVEASFSEFYGNMYSSVIGAGNSAAMLPESNKESNLHKLRAEYALSVKGFIPDEQYLQYVNESLDAWVNLRSELTAEDFLSSIIADEYALKKYFSNDDKAYFLTLVELYKNSNSDRASLVNEICGKLEKVELEAVAKVKPAVIPAPAVKADSGNKKKDKFRM